MSILDGLIRGASAGVIGAQQGVAARQQLERQALHEAMVQRLMEAQIGHLGAQSQALTAPKAPEPYTLAPGAGRYGPDGKLIVQNPAAPVKPERPITLAPGAKAIDPATGRVIAEGNPRANPQQSAAIVQKVAANKQQMGVIDEAVKGLKTRPQSVGVKGYLPHAILDRMDTAGVGVRSAISDIGSLKIHDRSGSAVSAAEMARLGFIPTEKDNAETAIIKLKRLRQYIQNETDLLSQTPVRDAEGNEVAPAQAPTQSTGPSSRARAAAAAALHRAGR